LKSSDFRVCLVARNVLLFSCLVDDIHNDQIGRLWEVYYHLYLDETAIDLLQTQVKKLMTASTSLQPWQASSYARAASTLSLLLGLTPVDFWTHATWFLAWTRCCLMLRREATVPSRPRCGAQPSGVETAG
jgi:hypothetical protein